MHEWPFLTPFFLYFVVQPWSQSTNCIFKIYFNITNGFNTSQVSPLRHNCITKLSILQDQDAFITFLSIQKALNPSFYFSKLITVWLSIEKTLKTLKKIVFLKLLPPKSINPSNILSKRIYIYICGERETHIYNAVSVACFYFDSFHLVFEQNKKAHKSIQLTICPPPTKPKEENKEDLKHINTTQKVTLHSQIVRPIYLDETHTKPIYYLENMSKISIQFDIY